MGSQSRLERILQSTWPVDVCQIQRMENRPRARGEMMKNVNRTAQIKTANRLIYYLKKLKLIYNFQVGSLAEN